MSSSATLATERRRSVRMPFSAPLVLHTRDDQSVEARSLVVSANGALIDSPEPFRVGADLEVENQRSGNRAKVWVVSTQPGEKAGLFAVTVEFLRDAAGFWGPAYR